MRSGGNEMAAPVSVDDFLIVLTRSKLVEEKAFDQFLVAGWDRFRTNRSSWPRP